MQTGPQRQNPEDQRRGRGEQPQPGEFPEIGRGPVMMGDAPPPTDESLNVIDELTGESEPATRRRRAKPKRRRS